MIDPQEKQPRGPARAGDSDDSVCAHCGQRDACRGVWSERNRGPFSGVGLGVASMVAFVLPWVLAVAAAAVVRALAKDDEAVSLGQIFAAAGGLLVGAVIAWLLMPRLKRRFSGTAAPSDSSSCLSKESSS